MTIVRVKVQAPADGPPVGAAGSLRWQPTARRILPATETEPASILLPNDFSVPLVGGEADIDVEPSTGVWVWAVMEHFAGQPSRRRFVHVPDQPTIDYADLVEIDPGTLDPIITTREPAWAAPFAELETATAELTATTATLAAAIITPDPDDPGFFLIGAN